MTPERSDQDVNAQPVTGGLSRNRTAFLHASLPAGGATIFLLNLVGEMVRRGIPAHVFSGDGAHPLAADFARRHIPVSLGRPRGLIFEDRVHATLRRLVPFAPDVVVANLDFVSGEVLRHSPPGLKRIGVVHAAVQVELAVCYASVMDQIVTVSDHVRTLLTQRAELRRLPVDCVELGFPIPMAVDRPDPVAGHPLRILYLGRLDEGAKRVRLFPSILTRLEKSGIPFRWTIAGEGPERPFLEARMTSQENQRVRFVGVVSYADVPALLAEHDVLLLTSDTETFSLSLHESMAAGLVPVVSDLPGPVRDVVTPEAGILVPPSEVSAYADGIIWLHEHRARMQSMSRQARSSIGSKYSVGRMTDRWLTFLTAPDRNPPNWPTHWKHFPPLFSPHSWRFSKPGRFLRRAAVMALSLSGK